MRSCPSCSRPLAYGKNTCLYCEGSASALELPLPDLPQPGAPGVGRSRAPNDSAPSRSRLPSVPMIMPPSGVEFARRRRLVNAVFALAILAVAAAVVAWFWPEDLEIDPRLVARFAPAMASYGAEFPPAAGSSAYVVGRLIPIEREPLDEVEVPRGFDPEAVEGALPASRWRLDDLYNSLPPDLVASSPDEVGTLARVSCGLVEDGLYVVEGSDDVAPGTAYRWRCSIELIDLRAGHQIARQDFLGGPPVFSTLVRDDFSGAPGARVAGNAYGPHPRDEMVEFLSALPRR